ncbi:hypothetical protein EFK50_17980 [Nocardioides marmoriginsengisoli]|uniref:Uncharacterized protein n=1 Tax=Nocardioides marmoriginsengisoli TaxID=661483 RepID=A0A3N0CCS2_9ACTN|nr:hypothetical protein [Nocardioides marmoriginsengisoli]RNL61254.1 hypothetical protein EFK50_17980 [Nocardioides marmoriginsengisoli]
MTTRANPAATADKSVLRYRIRALGICLGAGIVTGVGIAFVRLVGARGEWSCPDGSSSCTTSSAWMVAGVLTLIAAFGLLVWAVSAASGASAPDAEDVLDDARRAGRLHRATVVAIDDDRDAEGTLNHTYWLRVAPPDQTPWETTIRSSTSEYASQRVTVGTVLAVLRPHPEDPELVVVDGDVTASAALGTKLRPARGWPSTLGRHAQQIVSARRRSRRVRALGLLLYATGVVNGNLIVFHQLA